MMNGSATKFYVCSDDSHTHPAKQGVTCRWGEDEDDKKWRWNEHENEMRTI